MNCRFCNEELPEKGYFCPVCGMDQRSGDMPELETDPELTEFEFETDPEAEETVIEETPETDEEASEEETAESSKELKKSKRIAAITGCIAVLAILATVLFMGIRGGWDVKSWFDWQIFRENTLSYRDNYSVTDKKAGQKSDVVIANLGGSELTNGQLQIYYWSEVYSFVSNYYYYLSYFGLDYTQPLDQQQYMEGQTWQQYFLESALQTWQANQALCDQAKANGYVLPEESQQELDGMIQKMEADALEKGYDSALAMVQESFGAGCTVEDYVAYMEVYYYAYSYFAELYDDIVPTTEQIENYFTTNEETFKSEGITKEDGNYVDVRHILVTISSFATEDAPQAQADEETTGDGETGETEEAYTEEQWAACLAEAQRILDLWLENPTEDHFGELANEYSDDNNGNVTNGGLYADVTKTTNFVEPFLSWCMDENRQVGDYDIVRTDYGYHIMYFSDSEPIWFAESREAYIADEAQKIVNDALDVAEPEINYKKIVLGVVTF